MVRFTVGICATNVRYWCIMRESSKINFRCRAAIQINPQSHARGPGLRCRLWPFPSGWYSTDGTGHRRQRKSDHECGLAFHASQDAVNQSFRTMCVKNVDKSWRPQRKWTFCHQLAAIRIKGKENKRCGYNTTLCFAIGDRLHRYNNYVQL